MSEAQTSQPTAACDVFVLGGGPAGSTIATLLAQRGWSVVVAEKEHHPRFHIGESLLPLNLPLFERLGVSDQIERIGMRKHGAQFVSPDHDQPVTFDFANAWDKAHPSAYQVRRSQFDEVLFRNCVAQGAHGLEGCRVTSVDWGDDGVRLQARLDDGAQREWRARFFVDASGRDTFLANRLGLKKRNPKHCSAALFGHFTGAQRLPGREAGNISIFWFAHGWFWYIPLLDGSTSVGAVCWPYYMASRKTDPTSFLHETIALCPPLAERLRDAKLTAPATATGNYSYTCTRMYGDRYLLAGDAFAFVDPVFSSGVMLAMNSAFHAADAVDAWLRDPTAAAAAFRRFDRSVRHGLREFSWFIYRMTNPAMRRLIMGPRNYLRMEEAVLSLLAGDLFRGTPIYRSLRLFKLTYYLFGLSDLASSLKAWRKRKELIRPVQEDPAAGARA
jgi:flavin-dependent dehydrogenase